MAYDVPDPVAASVVSELWAAPSGPNVENDEFENGTTLTGWSRNYTPSATPISFLASFAGGDTREDYNSIRKSWFLLQPPGPGLGTGNTTGIHKLFAGGAALPDGLYLTRMKVEYRFGNIINDDGMCEFTLCASSAGQPDIQNKILLSVAESDAGLIAPQAQLTVAGVDTAVQMPNMESTGDHFEYAAIIRNGNVFSCWVGNGVSWVWLASLTYTGIPPIDRVLLACRNNGTGSPGNMVGGVDFFRYFTQQDLP